MTPLEKDKLESLCKKYGLSELGISKGIYMADDNSGITINLRGDVPLVGITIAGTLHTEGHGNRKVPDIQAEINNIIKSKKTQSSVPDLSAPSKEAATGSNPASGGMDKAPELNKRETTVKDDVMKGAIPSESKLGTGDTLAPAKKGTTTAICAGCSCKITGTIDAFQRIQAEYGQIYCLECSKKADGKVPATPAKQEAKPLTIPMCRKCGIEVPHARALACLGNNEQCTCEECGEKHESKHKEAEKGKAAQVDEPKARPEEPKRAEIVKMPAQKQPDALIPMRSYTPQGSIIKGFVPSLKEIGKIKIGKKSNKTTASGHRLPEKIDHFEIVGLVRDEQGNFPLDPIMKSLGENPKELNVFLLYNDLTLNFPTRYNSYKGGKCLCHGDGELATTIDGDEIICNPETCPTFQANGCKVNGILSCILADSPALGGVYKFRTGSFYSVRSILSSLMFLSTLTGGVLSMIPLKLTVTPMHVTPKGQMQTVYIVNVIFPGTMQNLLEATVTVSQYQSGMRAQIQQLEATAKLALAQPESEEEQKEYQDEFMPEGLK